MRRMNTGINSLDSTSVSNGARYALRSKKIFTMNASSEVVDGFVLVERGEILGVHPSSDSVPSDMSVIDVGDRPLLPGFVDPHVHSEMGARQIWNAVDCHTPPVGSMEELVETLSANINKRELNGGWLVGQGGLFANRRFADHRFPTRADLDRVSTSVPIAVRFGGHVTVVNSAGLELMFEAGVTYTGDAYAAIDESGEYTGELHELFYALPIPAPSEDDLGDTVCGFVREYLTAYGVTTIGEISNTTNGMATYARYSGSREMPVRTKMFVWSPGTMKIDDVFDAYSSGGLPSGRERYYENSGIKIFADGGISSAGAALLRPYRQQREGKPHMGRMTYPHDELVRIIRRCDELELRMLVHTQGERAQRLVCEAIIDARQDPADFLPVRLEHAGCTITDRETLDYWKRAAITPVPNAAMLWTVADFVPEYMGDYARSGMFPFRDLLDLGWNISSASDGSGSEPLNFNPLFGVQTAVTRQSCLGNFINPEQAVTVMEALHMHTSAAADALGETGTIGRIQKGAVADLIVLSDDPLSVDPYKIAAISVDAVLLGGELVSDPAGGSLSLSVAD